MTAIAESTPEPEICPQCKGTGFDHEVSEFYEGPRTACPYCEGEGYLPRCYTCGAALQLVRAGSFQCPNCG